MALQILTKDATNFTPASGSRITLDTDHLKCDDYAQSESYDGPGLIGINPTTGRVWMRTWGGTPAAVWYTGADLGSWTQVDLSDGHTTWSSGLAVDDDDSFYKVSNSDGYARKYNNAGTLQWTSSFNANDGCFFYPGNSHLYFCYYNGETVTEADKDGNVIHTHTPKNDNALCRYPTDIHVDSTGIYIICANTSQVVIAKYNFSWELQEVLDLYTEGAADIASQFARYGCGIVRRSNGNFIIGSLGTSAVSQIYLIEIDSSGNFLREVVGIGQQPEKGDGDSPGDLTGNCARLDTTGDYLYFCTARHGVVNKIDLRGADERLAEYQHDFGSSQNIQRILPYGRWDNRDSDWPTFRIWYQIDGGGYNEIDLTDPAIDINGQVLDIRIGMMSHGLRRNWPEFWGVEIVYDDGLASEFVSHIVATLEDKDSITARVEDKSKLTVRFSND